MTSFLVVYSTGEGQTRKVADRIAAPLDADGHAVTVVDVNDPPADLDVTAFDAVVVGGSIHMGTHSRHLVNFVRDHREAIADRPDAFFQVCLSSAVDDEERRAEAAGYVAEFVDATGWQPDRVASFGGALRYSEYGFLKRAMMRRIAKGATGDTDTSHDYEYTDWEEVEAFATDFAAFVAAGGAATDRGEAADEPAGRQPSDAR